jgi:hypothetical protein
MTGATSRVSRMTRMRAFAIAIAIAFDVVGWLVGCLALQAARLWLWMQVSTVEAGLPRCSDIDLQTPASSIGLMSDG